MGYTLPPPPAPPWKDCEACGGTGRVQFGNYLEPEARERAGRLGYPLRVCRLCDGKKGSGVKRPHIPPPPPRPRESWSEGINGVSIKIRIGGGEDRPVR